jgi:hypothetical protein
LVPAEVDIHRPLIAKDGSAERYALCNVATFSLRFDDAVPDQF